MNYSKGDVILLPYPFTDLSARKVRPAVVVGSNTSRYDDIFVIPLTSRISNLSDGERTLENWQIVGLNVPTAFKRGCILISTDLVIKKIGTLSTIDREHIDTALKLWFELNQ